MWPLETERPNYDSLAKDPAFTHTYKNKLGFKVKCYITKKMRYNAIVKNINGCGVYLKRMNLREL